MSITSKLVKAMELELAGDLDGMNKLLREIARVQWINGRPYSYDPNDYTNDARGTYAMR
jgi:hypothetical protein